MRAAKLRGFIRLQPPALGKLRVFFSFLGRFARIAAQTIPEMLFLSSEMFFTFCLKVFTIL